MRGQLAALIAAGLVGPDTRLPPIRQLATDAELLDAVRAALGSARSQPRPASATSEEDPW